MKKVVITGAGGFVGRRLASRFEEEKSVEVATFDPRKNSLFIPRTLRNLVSKAEVVYHLAAVNDPKGHGILKTNIFGTWGILEAVRRYSPSSRFIFASSFAVYKKPESKVIINEGYATIPRNIYGFTKLIGEKLCLFYSKIFGIKVLIMRISNIYGPMMPPFKHSVIATFIEKIRTGKNIEVSGNGEQTRDFIYIDDVIEALVLANLIIDRFIILNLCSGEETSINKLIRLISDSLHKEPKVSYGHLPDNGGLWKGDNSKARTKLGWVPKIILKKGWEKYYENWNLYSQLS